MGARRIDLSQWAMELTKQLNGAKPFEQFMGPFTQVFMDYGDTLNALRTLVEEMCRIDDSGCEVWEHVKAEVIPNSVPEDVRKLIGLDW